MIPLNYEMHEKDLLVVTILLQDMNFANLIHITPGISENVLPKPLFLG